MSFYAVFSWSMGILAKEVAKIEASGHQARGHHLPGFAEYEYVEADVLRFCEYTPEYVEGWKSKAIKSGKEFKGTVELPEAPRPFGGPPELGPKPQRMAAPDPGEANVSKSAKAARSKPFA